MKIVAVHGYQVNCRMPEPAGSMHGFMEQRDAVILRVVTESGVEGWGESWASSYPTGTYVRKRIVPRLLGRRADAILPIWQELRTGFGYDRRGVAMMALSAVDMALHDLNGRAQRRSVSALLGGGLRTRLPAYASGPFLCRGDDPYAGHAATVEQMLKDGYRAVKPRAGVDPRRDAGMAASLRRSIGADISLMLDFNGGYTSDAAVDVARRLEEHDIVWIEEPVDPDDLAGYRRVAGASSIAVAGGEALSNAAAFRDVLQQEAMSILQPDIAVCGGFTGMGKVAVLAEAFQTPVVPHVFGTAISFYASLQMAALLPMRRGRAFQPYPFIEVDCSGYPMLDLFGKIRPGADGCIEIPQGPGLGFELSEDRLAPWIEERWTEEL